MKIIYLAQFAPKDVPYVFNSPEDESYYNRYHYPLYESLIKTGHEVYSTNDLDFLIKNSTDYDLVFSIYHRIFFRNSEIFVSTLCEYLDIAYIGAAPNIRALSEDKSLSKLLAKQLNINTPEWFTASNEFGLPKHPPFSGPYFVKPRFGSASIGIDETNMCKTWRKTIIKSMEFLNDNIEIIVERFIDGELYTVPIVNQLNQIPLITNPYILVSNKKGNIITHKQKRAINKTMERKESTDFTLNSQIKFFSEQYFKNIQPCDYARIDFIVEKKTSIPYFIEVNTTANLGIQGGFAHMMKNEFFSTYDDLINHILSLGANRIKKKV